VDYYLTWRTPPLLREFYKRKLDESTWLLTEALRHEYGVDYTKNVEKALALYEKAYSLHMNSTAFCKRLCLLKRRSPESIGSCDEVVYELLRCMNRSNDIIISNLWNDIGRRSSLFRARVIRLIQRRLSRNPEDLEASLLNELYSLWAQKIDPHEFLGRVQPLVVKHKFVVAAETILQLCIPSE